jgi:hypothetical protein
MAEACRRVGVSEADPYRGAGWMSGIDLDYLLVPQSEPTNSPMTENRTILPLVRSGSSWTLLS